MTDDKAQQMDELMERMQQAKENWNDDEQDDTDRLLSQAMELAIEQGKGWAPGEKEAYMKTVMDDDFIPPIFASSQEELEKSGLSDAFSSLLHDETPTQNMLAAKQKGNDAFMDGKRNQVNNVSFYRDAINHYYEAFAWSQKVVPVDEQTTQQEEEEDETFTEQELNELKSNICANAAMAHMQLKNWGFVRDESLKALEYNDKNVKAWYRLAKAHEKLKNWEEAGSAVESGLAVEADNKDLLKLEKLLEDKVRKARRARQQRERARAERVVRVKEVWKHCKEEGIKLGRVPLVATVTDEEDEGDEVEESRWHSHHPHTGRLPTRVPPKGEWSWPCMFVYPSHSQSDFVESMVESEMLAMRMAEMFPELEESGDETAVLWDDKNEFVCSSLAVYFEVHCTEDDRKVVHPDSVELIKDQGSAMRFYEASRALKGDEGEEMANIARISERQHLHKQRKAWKKKHGSLRVRPDPCPVVRVHPAVTLRDVLTDSRMVVPNYVVTFVVFPENHPAHEAYLKEHKCIGIVQPEGMS